MTTTTEDILRLAHVYAIKGEYEPFRTAVESLVAERDALKTALVFAREELDGLPRSLGYEFTHLPAIDAALRGQP